MGFDKMRVLLIDPPGIDGIAVGRVLGSFGTNKADQAWPPYDLQVMAGYCKSQGMATRIIDANNLGLSYGEIKSEISKYNPRWVVYLTCFQTFELDAAVAVAAKEVDKDIATACISLSMPSVQDPQGKMRQHPALDYIAWGEPEYPIMRLLKGHPPDTVEGIYYRQSDNIRFTGHALRVADLDELGVPVQEGLHFNLYRCPLSRRRPLTIVNCSRGCMNSCVHCQAGNFQRPMRYRSVENVLTELRQVKKLGVKEIKFYDCSLPSKRGFMEELSQRMIAERLNFTWHCNARADVLDADILRLMKRSGCHTVSIGSESAIPEILKGMKKNATIEQIEHGIKLVKQSGMKVLMYQTFGLEGETPQTMEGTYRFIKRLMPDYVTFGIVVPAPGTPFYNSLKEQGFLVDKQLHQQDPTALASFNYPHLSGEEILAFTRNAYRTYYFSPEYILKRLLSLRSFNELRNSVTNALAVIRRYVIAGGGLPPFDS
ncbi:Fe-S oxidoreductase [Candidatus Magnetobacterium bavaricum]|uniref:Fe-S oxidoreductase n=1 Tax=Candidatus Magnetobacterium bavaricum TaxID=29290 RepID=A0A0F3H191_9BACT|nr:Fe-S oxidoreductase [Candidatus Magnetobacterium bavaricum]